MTDSVPEVITQYFDSKKKVYSNIMIYFPNYGNFWDQVNEPFDLLSFSQSSK